MKIIYHNDKKEKRQSYETILSKDYTSYSFDGNVFGDLMIHGFGASEIESISNAKLECERVINDMKEIIKELEEFINE